MQLLILLVIIVIVVAVFLQTILVALEVAIAILAALLLISIISYLNARKREPTEMVCPNCGSRDVKIRSRVNGVNAKGKDWSVWSVSTHHEGNVGIKRNRIGVCQECGFDFPYLTEEDIQNQKDSISSAMMLIIILIAIASFLLVKGRKLADEFAENANSEKCEVETYLSDLLDG